MPNFMSIGCIVSKLDRGSPIDPPQVFVQLFLFEASRVNGEYILRKL